MPRRKRKPRRTIPHKVEGFIRQLEEASQRAIELSAIDDAVLLCDAAFRTDIDRSCARLLTKLKHLHHGTLTRDKVTPVLDSFIVKSGQSLVFDGLARAFPNQFASDEWERLPDKNLSTIAEHLINRARLALAFHDPSKIQFGVLCMAISRTLLFLENYDPVIRMARLQEALDRHTTKGDKHHPSTTPGIDIA